MKTARVGDLAAQVRGVTFAKEDASVEPRPNTVGVVRAGNIVDGNLDTRDLVFVPSTKVGEKQILRANDVLIATSSGSLDVVGKAARVRRDQSVAFGAFCKVLRPSMMVDPGYFAHFFQTVGYRRHVSSVAAGANINNLRSGDLDDLEIPLPPIEEQRRITAVLDAADVLRAKRRQALAKLDTLTHATFIDMFGDPVTNAMGWPVVSVGDALESATYGTSRKSGAAGEFAVLRMGNLTADGRIDLSDLRFTDLVGREREQHLVVEGDVLFNRTNSPELVGKTAVFRFAEPMAYAGYLIRLRPSAQLEAEYLGTFMNLATTKQLLRAMCKSIVGMANINAKEVQTIRMPLPPIDLQRAFASKVHAVEARRSLTLNQLAVLDALFASLQHRAFRGEL